MTAPAVVGHVANVGRRYPGETVAFHTRIRVSEPLSAPTLRVSLPRECVLETYRAVAGFAGATPSVEVDQEQNHYMTWTFDGDVAAGSEHECVTVCRIAPAGRDVRLESRAVLTGADAAPVAEETLALNVEAQGRYLRYLPEVYEQDELMGRFLMLFESFWGPIETQIDHAHCYFDPQMAPASFLPWLASWMNATLDDRLPEERQRLLLQAAVPLYRRRGTKEGLEQYLDLYTGGTAHIVEHRAQDFVLGPAAHLGPGIALGRTNVPHTFTVVLTLPPVGAPSGSDEQAVAALEEQRRRVIQSIIETEKPAHTGYTLHLEVKEI
ncbi:MAG: hypothetical protein JXD18_02125 [Anaerolineae bacterium]|nr:hypothetical protein [Anaerolineae bacterium]